MLQLVTTLAGDMVHMLCGCAPCTADAWCTFVCVLCWLHAQLICTAWSAWVEWIGGKRPQFVKQRAAVCWRAACLYVASGSCILQPGISVGPPCDAWVFTKAGAAAGQHTIHTVHTLHMSPGAAVLTCQHMRQDSQHMRRPANGLCDSSAAVCWFVSYL